MPIYFSNHIKKKNGFKYLKLAYTFFYPEANFLRERVCCNLFVLGWDKF